MSKHTSLTTQRNTWVKSPHKTDFHETVKVDQTITGIIIISDPKRLDSILN